MSRPKKEKPQMGLLGVDTREQENRAALRIEAEEVRKSVFRIPVVPFTETHLVRADQRPICDPEKQWEHAGKDDSPTTVCAACMAEASRMRMVVR